METGGVDRPAKAAAVCPHAAQWLWGETVISTDCDRLALAQPEEEMRVSGRSIGKQEENVSESAGGPATALEIVIATAPDAPFSNWGLMDESTNVVD